VPLHAFTHVQLALSERNREPVLTFSKERFPTYQCFHTPASLLPRINVSCSLPPVSCFSCPAPLPAATPTPQLYAVHLHPKIPTPLPSPSSCICSKQRPSYVPLSVEDAARVPPCSAPLALIPSPPFRFESGLRAAHVYCPILGTSPATGELFPA
jgi:hypothetical protein